jgi:integrase
MGRRRARAIRWLYATGLRLSEMAGAHCGDLQCVDYRTPDGAQETGWLLDVIGKGDKVRQVPVPSHLVEELQRELERSGLVEECAMSQTATFRSLRELRTVLRSRYPRQGWRRE